MRGQRKNPRKAVQPFENKKRKIDIFKNYEANGVEKIQRKLEIFSTLISKKSREAVATSLLECFRPNRFRMADMELDGFAVVTRSIVEAKTKANGPRFAVSSRSNGRLSCDLKNLLL